MLFIVNYLKSMRTVIIISATLLPLISFRSIDYKTLLDFARKASTEFMCVSASLD